MDYKYKNLLNLIRAKHSLRWRWCICMQEAGRLYLRCCCFELHGREGWGLQAGDHRQRESVCHHRIRHRSAEGFPLETTYWPGAAAVPRRRWALIQTLHDIINNTLRLSSVLSVCAYFCLTGTLYVNQGSGVSPVRCVLHQQGRRLTGKS